MVNFVDRIIIKIMMVKMKCKENAAHERAIQKVVVSRKRRFLNR